ncbi:MAG TPA: radical SAM protein [Thermoanaerobaculia bacterium]|nr:radical SAM protein [Thermoanaerobaculia bacterium]
MRVGVLEMLTDAVSYGWIARHYDSRFRRHYASITPQAVAVWCQQLGHEVHYATYYGQRPPDSLLPDGLDVVFLATYTQASALAYALARLYRRRGALTVLGGPHATSFPTDSLRFFDLVVHDCDKELIAAILRGDFEPGSVVSSGHILEDVPSVEERLPLITKASFVRGRPARMSNVPMLTSLGCPYRCDFCVDWKNDYVMMPQERLLADLRYVTEHLPGVLIGFHDPNFGVKFDEVLDLMEQIPRERRNPYVMESSLSILRGPRLQRLRETNCIYVAPGVESWTDYSNKAGVGRSVGKEKLDSVIEHFEELHRYVPGLQANFLFGTDGDEGEDPVAMTQEFIRRLPFVWPTFNIPIPFGGTPMYDRYLAEDRILEQVPFAFYYMPYMVIRPRHYDPLTYYAMLIRLYHTAVSSKLLLRRVRSARTRGLQILHALRTMGMRAELGRLRAIHDRMARDPEILSFMRRGSRRLPAFYRERLKSRLGVYGELLSEADVRPELEPPDSASAGASKVVTIGGRRSRISAAG